MYNQLTLKKKVKDLALDLKEQYKISDFEALSLALNVERNEVLSRAFVLTDSDEHPTALEKIVHKLESIKFNMSS